MFIKPFSPNLAGLREWGVHENDAAWELLAEHFRKSERIQIVSGELGALKSATFWQIVQRALDVGRPRFHICSGISTEPASIGRSHQRPDTTAVARSVVNQIRAQPQGEPNWAWVSLFKRALHASLIQMHVGSGPVTTPHFTLIDGRKLFLEQLHTSGQPKRIWFIERAWPITSLYMREFSRLTACATRLDACDVKPKEGGLE